jgi:hypothetical protein
MSYPPFHPITPVHIYGLDFYLMLPIDFDVDFLVIIIDINDLNGVIFIWLVL